MRKRLPIILIILAITASGCATSISIKELRKRAILDMELILSDLFASDRTPAKLAPKGNYLFDMFLICDNNEKYSFDHKQRISLSSPNRTLSADFNKGKILVKTNGDYFNLAMEDSYLLDIYIRLGSRQEYFQKRWAPDWERITPPDYSGKEGDDGSSIFSSIGALLDSTFDGNSGTDGGNGTDVVLNIAFYDNGTNPPFLIMHDIDRKKIYCFRKWPVTIDADGGDGGDGESGNGGEDDEKVSGGNGGDGGNGGRIIINYPESMDILKVINAHARAGRGGSAGWGDNGGMNGSSGTNGNAGSILYVPVSDIKSSDFFPVKDPRFNPEYLTGKTP